MRSRTVLLLRHGRTEYNAAGRLQGQVDIPLDDVGRWQAREAAHDLVQRHRPTRIVSSDLSRAHETAQAVADLADVEVELDPRLRERSFGDWEGLTADEMGARWPAEYAVWRSGHDPQRTGAETRRAVAERMATAIAEHAERTDPDGALVVVSHGAAVTLGLTALLGLDADDWRGLVGLNNAHWAVLRSNVQDSAPRWRLEALNVGPAVQLSAWNAGERTESLPSSAADALRA